MLKKNAFSLTNDASSLLMWAVLNLHHISAMDVDAPKLQSKQIKSPITKKNLITTPKRIKPVIQ